MATDNADAVGNRTITLPTRGELYGDKFPGGALTIKRMTATDQAILFSQGSVEDRINKIIANTTVMPAGFSQSELLTVDRMAILLAVRIFTFGPAYEFSYQCKQCRATQKHVCDITEDLNQTAVEKLEEPFEIKLPDCGKTVALRFMRGKDEEAVVKYAKRMAMQSSDPADPSNLHRQARLIVSIDGDTSIDIVRKEAFAKGLSARDSIIIDNELDAREPGIDLTVMCECKRCQAQNDMKLPFDLEFFRPSALRA